MSSEIPPKTEYERRLSERRAAADLCARRDTYLANARFAVFALGLGLLGASLATEAVNLALTAFPLAVFISLAVAHDRVLRAKERAEQATAFYERGLDRLGGRWMGKGNPGLVHSPKSHLYAEDLDLFGEASLFELLCTARTHSGQELLAKWLCASADAAEIEARQKAVIELRAGIDLREDCAVLGRDIREGVQPAFLAD